MTERAHRESLANILADIRAELGPATDEETATSDAIDASVVLVARVVTE